MFCLPFTDMKKEGLVFPDFMTVFCLICEMKYRLK